MSLKVYRADGTEKVDLVGNAPAQGYVVKAGDALQPEWSRIAEASSVAACLLTHSTSQSLSSDALVSFDTEIVDTDGMHTASGSRITVNTPGIYLVSAVLMMFESNTTGEWRRITIVHYNAANTQLRSAEVLRTQTATNGYWRDDMAHTFKAAAGDYFVLQVSWATASSPQTFPGSSGTPLFSAVRLGDASGLAELTVPACILGRTTTTVSSGGSGTALGWSVSDELVDTNEMHDAASITRITFKTPGLYLITGYVDWPAQAGGHREAWINLNGGSGVADRLDDAIQSPDSANLARQNVTAIHNAVVGDFVHLYAYQNSGVSLAPGHRFSAVRIGRATGSVGGEAWIAPASFGGNWGYYDATPNYPVRYYKDPNGIVRCKGLAKPTSTPGQTWSQHIIQLSVGYRPEDDIYLPGSGHDGTNYVSTNLFIRGAAAGADAGKVALLTPVNIGATGYISLASISFRAA